LAEAVAHRILDPQGREFEALQRTFLRRDIDADGVLDLEVFQPVDRMGGGVHILIACIRKFTDPPKDAGRNPRPEVYTVASLTGARESYASGYALRFLDSEGKQFLFKETFQSPRGAREEILRTA